MITLRVPGANVECCRGTIIKRGRSSGVERNLAKVEVVSSNLIARSIFSWEIKEHWSHTPAAIRQLPAERCANRQSDTCRIRAIRLTYVPNTPAIRDPDQLFPLLLELARRNRRAADPGSHKFRPVIPRHHSGIFGKIERSAQAGRGGQRTSFCHLRGCESAVRYYACGTQAASTSCLSTV